MSACSMAIGGAGAGRIAARRAPSIGGPFVCEPPTLTGRGNTCSRCCARENDESTAHGCIRRGPTKDLHDRGSAPLAPADRPRFLKKTSPAATRSQAAGRGGGRFLGLGVEPGHRGHSFRRWGHMRNTARSRRPPSRAANWCRVVSGRVRERCSRRVGRHGRRLPGPHLGFSTANIVARASGPISISASRLGDHGSKAVAGRDRRRSSISDCARRGERWPVKAALQQAARRTETLQGDRDRVWHRFDCRYGF